MHPPFYVVDHKVDYDPRPFEERRVTRRNRPQSLRFDPPMRLYPVETFELVPNVIIRAPGPGFRIRLARLLYRIIAGHPVPLVAGERA